MPYIIDGHNLIPHISGLNLTDPDDENSLIEILQRFASLRRTRIEVYFDQAPAARARSQPHGLVRAHYIEANSTADQAIKKKLSRLAKAAKNWTVVSSDREIQAEATSYQCPVINSPEFAELLRSGGTAQKPAGEKIAQPEISPDEVDYWLDQFGGG
jgi:predicted RNA-binding protein with PIN domain